METVITINNLSKKFKLYKKEYYRIAEALTGKSFHKDYWALKDISIEVKKGDAVGIIGANGAGKSTLLKLICGALYPTTGEIDIKGRVLSLLELGTGFHPELTGIENIYNSASMQGFSRKEMEGKLEDIIEFADIGEHINSPVKTYSSGMYVRLAFALYACLEPDIYIVDEALSVGDVFFQQKCYERMREMKKQGVTIIMVSHDPAPVVSFCNRAILIEEGKIIGEGAPNVILEMYQALEYSKGMKIQADISCSENIEFGNKEAVFTSYRMVDAEEKEKKIWGIGENSKIQIECYSENIRESVCVGMQIKNAIGQIIFGTNSNWLGEELKFEEKRLACSFEFPVNLGEGSYTISLAISENKRNPVLIYCWREKVINFDVVNMEMALSGGIVYLPIKFGKK